MQLWMQWIDVNLIADPSLSKLCTHPKGSKLVTRYGLRSWVYDMTDDDRWSAGDSLCESWASIMAIRMSFVISECRSQIHGHVHILDPLTDQRIQWSNQRHHSWSSKSPSHSLDQLHDNVMSCLCPFWVVAGTRWRLQALHVAAIEAAPSTSKYCSGTQTSISFCQLQLILFYIILSITTREIVNDG